MSSPKTTRILIVDDEPLILRATKRLLRAHGYPDVIEAATEEEAKRRIESEPVDLVITDLHIGPGSGIRVAEFATARHIPAVITTGSEPPPLAWPLHRKTDGAGNLIRLIEQAISKKSALELEESES